MIAGKVYGKVRTMLRSITRAVLIPALLFLALAYFIKTNLITALYGPEFIPAAEPFLFYSFAQ
ncbi:MAG: hypothetical protein IPP46_06885 [Bacteroidetes bacterium]|nr:hypothetical protein [Bacteroidota bacterium]